MNDALSVVGSIHTDPALIVVGRSRVGSLQCSSVIGSANFMGDGAVSSTAACESAFSILGSSELLAALSVAGAASAESSLSIHDAQLVLSTFSIFDAVAFC
jgi:hypothetical protein